MFIQVIKELKETGVLDLVAVIISPIISFIVLICTLKHSKKQFEIQINNQKSEHNESMALMSKQHSQSINTQMENNRILAMPYFVIDKNIDITTENNILYFRISFTNAGNGTATHLRCKCLDESDGQYLCPMCKTATAVYGCGLPFDFETNVVKPNGECYFTMYRARLQESDTDIDKVIFSIEFLDMYNNKYEQSFEFLFDNQFHGTKEIRIGRVQTLSTELIQRSSQCD